MSNEEIGPEISEIVNISTDDPNTESHSTVPNPENKRPAIEDPEKLKQPGEIVPSVRSGIIHFTYNTIVRDGDGRLAQVEKFNLVEESEKYKWDDDPSIRKPKKSVNPELHISYEDGTEKDIKAKTKLPIPVYADYKRPIQEYEDYFKQSHFELRGHDFRLGELVSFGNGVGRLALIVSGDNPQFGIVAEKVRGKGGPTNIWMVDVNKVDYIEHDEKGAIKIYPDQTLFKPTLGNPEFDQNTDI